MRPDKNFLNFAGLRGTADEPIVRHIGVVNPPDGSYADALKITDCQHLIIYADEIHGGYEDAVDLNNRCRNVQVHCKRWYPRGQYVATVKGESSDIVLSGEIIGRGKQTDIDLGGHSDQARGRTKNVRLCLRADRPIDVRVLHAWDPILVNAPDQPYRVDARAQGWFAHLWRLLKRLIPGV